MTMAEKQDALNCIDEMGVCLANHDHQWTAEQRRCYEETVRVLSKSLRAASATTNASVMMEVL